MNHRPDSAQLLAAIGSTGGFILANFDRLAATACALVGLVYTLWKWRREYLAKTRPPVARD